MSEWMYWTIAVILAIPLISMIISKIMGWQ